MCFSPDTQTRHRSTRPTLKKAPDGETAPRLTFGGQRASPSGGFLARRVAFFCAFCQRTHHPHDAEESAGRGDRSSTGVFSDDPHGSGGGLNASRKQRLETMRSFGIFREESSRRLGCSLFSFTPFGTAYSMPSSSRRLCRICC